jgi:CO/xanthine dehydrogenase FAD-binding subunit
VGPKALRFPRAEQLLEGQDPAPDLLQAVAREVAADCQPIDDVRASAAFRRRLAQTLTERVLQSCLARITGADT